MSLAATRDKRCNAGSRISRMLEAEEEDDFYKTTYGGFDEEANDDDYESEASVSDNVDSDFDIDEHEERRSDVDDDDQPRRKRKGVDTKAYKEPKKAKTSESKPKPKKYHPRPERSTVQIYHSEIGKKALRRTTAEKSRGTQDREKERETRAKMMKDIAVRKNVSEVRRLTQEELLAEARITEQINLKSLETYYRMELEKKKARVQKRVHHGPMIRYHSVTMPLIEELPEAEINVDEEATDSNNDGDAHKRPLKAAEKCSRTFITFTDEKSLRDVFSRKHAKPSVKRYCPVTRLPAKYFDPITQTPYATSQAFKLIREAYQQHLDSGSESKRGDANGRKAKPPKSQVQTLVQQAKT